MTQSLPCSLVLAAHGSEAAESCNRPIFELADAIRDTQIFSEVMPAFLNGEPSLNNVFDFLPPGDVVLVPLMTSEGYYVKTILPGKIAENKRLDEYRVFLTPALGVQPRIAQIVADRINTLINLFQLPLAETSILLVGHGTRRHPESESSTHDLASALQKLVPEPATEVAFIDQEPTIETVAPQISKHCLVVPFLIGRGPHATIDVPKSMGLPYGLEIEFPIIGHQNNRIVICDLPVGMYPEITDVCLELATDQLMTGSPIEVSSLSNGRSA